MTLKTGTIVAATLLAAFAGASTLCEGRGGGGGGGGRAGGGGFSHAGGGGVSRGSAPSFHPAPSFSGGARPSVGGGNHGFEGGNHGFEGGNRGQIGNNNANIGNRGQIGNNNINAGNRGQIGNNNINAGNRGQIGNNNINAGNRGQIGNNNINAGNRGQIGNNNINAGNRGQIGNNTINAGNRTNINTGNINAGNRNVNVVNNRVTNVNNVGGMAGRTPYAAYHSNFVHGYWNPHFGGYGGYGGYGLGGYGGYGGYGYGGYGLGLGFGLGLATVGLASWALSPMMYNWGYSNYNNPYYGMGNAGGVGVQQAVGYNYAQPINPQSPPPDQAVSDAAVASFDAGRDAFKSGNYPQALQLTDQALTQMPNDPVLHEFRALALFALQRYDDAAVPLYAVLSAGPGWDWTTMISLYPNVDAYTAQLRTLEAFCRAQPKSPAGHFVLAYHYMTAGFAPNAVSELKLVSQLQPNDQLTARLVDQLSKAPEPAPGAGGSPADVPPATPPQPPPAATPPPGASIFGTWTANPNADTSIALTLNENGEFVWKVTEKGQPRQFGGTSTYGNGILTLAQQGQQQSGAMVGRVTWSGPEKFTFQALGGGQGDPGLTFSR